MSPRKRKRDQFISREEEEAELNDAEAETLTEEQKAQKQQEIWDAFREAHYEALEQLPLTLHRQLSLMRQLDEQAHNYGARILPTLLKYIQKRQEMSKGQNQAHGDDSLQLPAGSPVPLHSNSVQSQTSEDVKFTPSLARSSSKQGSLVSSRTSPPMGMPPNRLHPPEKMCDLLAHVAWLSDEIVHVSQEKVNLALSTHDSVERHIRLLDQAIKEQEISLSNGSSHPVIHLPDLAVPRWTRATRTALSPLEDSTSNLGGYRGGAPFADPVVLDKSSHRSLKKKGRHSHRAPDGRFEDQSDTSKDPTPLTITLPATHASEELYCYCNRVSFGEMIACDGETCEREWFHLGCVGLLRPPEGDWYCEDCRGEDT